MSDVTDRAVERGALARRAGFCTHLHRFAQRESENSIDEKLRRDYRHARLNREA